MKKDENSTERSKKGFISNFINAVKKAVGIYKENREETVRKAVKEQQETGTNNTQTGDNKLSSKKQAASERAKAPGTGVLVVGTSGCGKSSTINALLGSKVALVHDEFSDESGGSGAYSKGDLTLHEISDAGIEDEMKSYKKGVIDKIAALDRDGNRIVDLVLLIVDGSGRELGVVCDLLSNAILPIIGPKQKIAVAINQADMVMKGRNWDYEKSEPNQTLIAVLEEKAESVKRRIFESTGLAVDAICYSAGCTDEDGNQSAPYNLQALKKLMSEALEEPQKSVFEREVNGSCIDAAEVQ